MSSATICGSSHSGKWPPRPPSVHRSTRARRSTSPPQSLHRRNFSTSHPARPTGESFSAYARVRGFVAALPAGHPLGERDDVGLDDLTGETLVLNVVSGTMSTDLWPPARRPERTVEVGNTDEWLMAIAAGTAVGVTVRSSESMYAHPDVVYRPIRDAAPVSVSLMWREPPSHPGCAALAAHVERHFRQV